jgi:hypothetical protein
MNLMGKCKHCDRDLLLTQLLESGTVGRCPWCGAMLVHHYTALLPRLIDEAERAGRELGRALRLLSDGWTGFKIDDRTILGPIAASLLDRDEGDQSGDEAIATAAVTRRTECERAA